MTTDTEGRQTVRARRGRDGDRARAPEAEGALEEPDVQEDLDEALDELLRLQLTGIAPEEAVLFEDDEGEARARPTDDDGVRPRTAGEFVCHGCFLVKSRAQLADSERSLCRDCSDDAGVH